MPMRVFLICAKANDFEMVLCGCGEAKMCRESE